MGDSIAVVVDFEGRYLCSLGCCPRDRGDAGAQIALCGTLQDCYLACLAQSAGGPAGADPSDQILDGGPHFAGVSDASVEFVARTLVPRAAPNTCTGTN